MLENSTDRKTWRAAVHGVAESDTPEQLSTELVCNVVLISDLQQSEPVPHIPPLLQILSPRMSLQSVEQSSLGSKRELGTSW